MAKSSTELGGAARRGFRHLEMLATPKTTRRRVKIAGLRSFSAVRDGSAKGAVTLHRRDRRELFSPRGLRAYQDGNDHSDWISGRTVDRAVILCAAEEFGCVLLHRTTSRFANFSSAGRPGRICPRGHCVPAHRTIVWQSAALGGPPAASAAQTLVRPSPPDRGRWVCHANHGPSPSRRG